MFIYCYVISNTKKKTTNNIKENQIKSNKNYKIFEHFQY